MPFTPIFKSEISNNALKEKGYAVVPYLKEVEIKELSDFFYQNHPNLPEGMYASSHAKDFAFRQKMNDKIQSVCKRAAAENFQEAKVLGATFMVKSKGENGALQPHQDWNIVDEKQFNSYNIWLPLVDVDEDNGTLLILPDSHQWFKNIRGQNIPSSYENVTDEVWKYLRPIKMKAGEALIYDHRLLHASGINRNDQPRLVIVSGLIPEAAEMRYYYGRENNIEEYACTPEFYFNENINEGPKGLKLIQSFPDRNPTVSLLELHNVYEPKISFLQRLKGYFK
ncbi:MAG: phytanoyl-CoA dioxygenase family protein [Chitinophagales bacterium]